MSRAVIIGSRAAPKGAAYGQDRIRRHITANFYPTPPEATRALLSVETFNGLIWEPACGEGHIAKELIAAGHDVHPTDLNNWGYGITGIDFLSPLALKRTWLDGRPPRGTHIVTNPPYGSGLADAFVEKAIAITAETHGKVAMLLNLNSLAHVRRTAFWRTTKPRRIWITDSVVCWPDPVRSPPPHFLDNRYFWAVWEGAHDRPCEVNWLSARDFVSRKAPRFQHQGGHA